MFICWGAHVRLPAWRTCLSPTSAKLHQLDTASGVSLNTFPILWEPHGKSQPAATLLLSTVQAAIGKGYGPFYY